MVKLRGPYTIISQSLLRLTDIYVDYREGEEIMKSLLKPVKRSHLRRIMGMTHYSIRRYLKWISLVNIPPRECTKTGRIEQRFRRD